MDRSATEVTWSITADARAAFVLASGDRNPIHTDPIAARRLLGGRMLVHGAHVLLAVIDQAVENGLLQDRPAGLTVTFRRGIAPGTPLVSQLVRDGNVVTARVVGDDGLAVDVALDVAVDVVAVDRDGRDGRSGTDGPDDLQAGAATGVGGPPGAIDVPDDLGIEDMAGVSGRFHLPGDVAELVSGLFPAAVRLLGADAVREIAAISGVVGMRVPGLRSMSSRYDITFRPHDGSADRRAPGLVFRVERADPRIRRVVVDVVGSRIRANVTAFSPSGPVDQRAVLAGGPAPEAGEFFGRRVLVVGGSRGLGEAAVRLLVDGGADVRFTWFVGADEADALTDQTGATGVCFDARTGALDPVVLEDWTPTHLAWFATPPTGGGAVGIFSNTRYRALRAVQVDAFERSVDALVGSGLTDVLWPSSIDVERADTAVDELAAVRIAGEQTCAALDARHRGLSVTSARLPRLLTDNTVSLVPVEYDDTATALLAALRTRR